MNGQKREQLLAGGWRWVVSCYYGEAAKPPRQPGDLAIETVHKTDVSKDIEVAAAQSRPEIGRIVVAPLVPEVGEPTVRT